MKKIQTLNIVYLYGDLMNTYGDTGNITTLSQRANWRGIKVQVTEVTLKDKLNPAETDLIFFGGGQDQAQNAVAKDLIGSGKGKIIRSLVDKGVPLLAVCGGYQLLGEYYLPHSADKIPGTGLFPVYTEAGHKRMIGNIIVKLNDANLTEFIGSPYLVGFENHSGKTYLLQKNQTLGQVQIGLGNNGEDRTEGCIYKNAIGCYMHGSLLPKNSHLADWFLKKALEIKYQEKVELQPLDDKFEWQAHQNILKMYL